MQEVVEPSISWQDTSANHPKHDKFIQILEKYTAERALPGLSLLIYTPENGIWTGASGFAQLENQTVLSPAHLVNASDASSMFASILALRLIEDGILNLDDPITNYLDKKYTDFRNSGKITVRHLLQQTSGIQDVISLRKSMLDVLNNYEDKTSPQDYIKMIKRKKPEFEPEKGAKYSATNSMLLMLIVENLTELDHADLIEQVVFQEVGALNSYYKNSVDYPFVDGQMNFYVDRLNDGKLENITKALMKQNQYNAYGFDGVLTTLYDLHLLVNQVFRDSLFLPETMQEIQSFTAQTDENGVRYGLGIQRIKTSLGMGLGYHGTSYGSTLYVFYFPENDATIIFHTNTGIETAKWASDAIDDFWNEILNEALK